MNIKINNKGFSLIEVVITMIILVIIVLSITKIQYFMSNQTVRIKEKTFATQKVIQMMEELRSLVTGLEKEQINVLDDYDDGNTYNTVLTTDKNITNPSTVSSDNIGINNGWKYLRRVTILRVPEDAFTRKVYVRVYKALPSDPTHPETLAETMSILRTITTKYVPTQVFDLYVLALENVPGYSVFFFTLKPMFERMISDIQSRCPGLELRVHWVTRLSYGRDTQYVPYVNKTNHTSDIPMPFVYFYPGLCRAIDNSDFLYFDSDRMQGRVRLDAAASPYIDPLVTNPLSYVMSDRFNHALRYPDEKRIYDSIFPKPEVSLRMLIEEMNSDDPVIHNKWKNVIIVNLHSEQTPYPPIRNYSDAAKDPQAFPDVRVVSHPEKLNYPINSDISLRVYAYFMNPNNHPYVPVLPSLPVATVFIPDKDIPTGSIHVNIIIGSSTVDYSNLPATDPANYHVSHPIPLTNTLIELYNTPLRHPPNPSGRGLLATKWLYGLEYIPCPVEDPVITPAPYFSRDLACPLAIPKNTARWIIRFTNTAGSLNGMNTFETRIGNNTTTDFPNLSRTYTWVGPTPAVPATEKYQFMGDPRHCPYSDVKQSSGYNWYFTPVPAADYQGFSKATNGWLSTWIYRGTDIDLPRFNQTYRQGLLKTQAILTGISAATFSFYGIGGEFGSEGYAPLGNGIVFNRLPFVTDGSTGRKYVSEMIPGLGVSPVLSDYDSCTDHTRVETARIAAMKDLSWYSKPWLGELYPDSEYANWNTYGNLRTGTTPDRFYRAKYLDIPGAVFDRNRDPFTLNRGLQSFANGGPTGLGSGPLEQIYRDNNNAHRVDPLGSALANMFNFSLPQDLLKLDYPINLNVNTDFPPEWGDLDYQGQRTTLSIPAISGTPRTYYNTDFAGPPAGSWSTSSTLRVSKGTDNFYFVINGLAWQYGIGSALIGKLCLMTIIRAFLDGGLYSTVLSPAIPEFKISQVPLLTITSPTDVGNTFTNPTSINIAWSNDWKRWGGNNYTEEYPAGYTEATTLKYSLKYSNDKGSTWHYCDGDSDTTPGEKNSGHFVTTPPLTYTWNVPAADFPTGSYLIRVECYRETIDLHYSYNQLQLFIKR
ncbi:MAG: prepilin-type N-terminal cleavage/methylation domain-containing protein [Elusimicrobia bacterium]|nr:prepilin-type N-terminal cleavage/methylation domain-containing protein [Elusimicrobiota bacterium]